MDQAVVERSRAMWLWEAPVAPAQVAEFAARERVGEVFVSVPWEGPTTATRALVRALRRRGIRSACLGSGADWADRPDNAASWATRALADDGFDAVHLDIEPWAAGDWPAHAAQRLAGLARAVAAVRAIAAVPVEVDLAAAHVAAYPDLFARVMTAASAVTVMAYRDRAPAILDLSESARRIAAAVDRPFRVGVDTRPSIYAHATFADDGRRVLEGETASVAESLRADPRFVGIAVHDHAHWRELRP